MLFHDLDLDAGVVLNCVGAAAAESILGFLLGQRGPEIKY